MIKYKWFYLRILLFTILILYGCAAPPIPTPQNEIIISRAILNELDRFKIRNWKYIVIHHSASYKGSASSIDAYHRKEKGWKNGLGYHFIIGNGNGARNGQIEVGDRWNKQMKGAHAGDDEYNEYGIGICLVGNFDNSQPSEAQLSSLIYLVKYLQARCNIPRRNIIMHKNIKTTDCPGNRFPYNKLMTSL